MDNHILVVSALLSLLPVSELRGAIPYMAANNIPPLFAYFYCVFFNSLVGLFSIYLYLPFTRYLSALNGTGIFLIILLQKQEIKSEIRLINTDILVLCFCCSTSAYNRGLHRNYRSMGPWYAEKKNSSCSNCRGIDCRYNCYSYLISRT